MKDRIVTKKLLKKYARNKIASFNDLNLSP